MAQSLNGKVAIITGASSGIGLASARLLAAQGVRLALVARSPDRLEAAKAELGDGTLAVPADLTRPAEVDAMISTATAHFGRVDILFANAGAYVPGDAADGDADAWDRMIQLNVNAVFRAVRAVLPGMIERRSGDIVVTSSVSGHQAIQWEPVYSATKHAVQSFVHGVRRQIGPASARWRRASCSTACGA
jgi:ribitol 2-dehydrogenase